MLSDSGSIVRLLQLLLNPLLSAGLQAVAQPAPAGPVPVPMRQPLAPGALQPVFVPPSVVQALMSSSRAPAPAPWQDPYYYYYTYPEPQPGPAPRPPPTPPAGSALAALQQLLEQYARPPQDSQGPQDPQGAQGAQGQDVTAETASPMPMATLLTIISNVTSGFRIMIVNFVTSFVVMGAVQVMRIAFENLPIILSILGLTRTSMARVIAQGMTRAQCLERAACVLGEHAHTYPSTPDVLRWLRSPDGSTPEHPVWAAFRAAAEGRDMQCDAYAC